MFCPLSSMIEKAYTKKYYPDKYAEMLSYIRDFESKKGITIYHKPIDEIDRRIDEKYIDKVV